MRQEGETHRKKMSPLLNPLFIICRQEAVNHEMRMKKLEELYDDHIEKIKKTIEKKIKQSQEFLSLQKKNQKALKNKNCEQYARTLALRAELEGKLDLWRKQVLSVQSLSIR